MTGEYWGKRLLLEREIFNVPAERRNNNAEIVMAFRIVLRGGLMSFSYIKVSRDFVMGPFSSKPPSNQPVSSKSIWDDCNRVAT